MVEPLQRARLRPRFNRGLAEDPNEPIQINLPIPEVNGKIAISLKKLSTITLDKYGQMLKATG